MPELRAGVLLTPLKRRIFDYVQHHSGQSSADIASAILDRTGLDAARNIRVHIHQINDLLAHTDTRIRGVQGWGYQIIELRRRAA